MVINVKKIVQKIVKIYFVKNKVENVNVKMNILIKKKIVKNAFLIILDLIVIKIVILIVIYQIKLIVKKMVNVINVK